jgi:hypothetical protein
VRPSDGLQVAAGGLDRLLAAATETYIYLYPLVTMEVTRRQAVRVDSSTARGAAPMNSFGQVRHLAEPGRVPRRWEDLDLLTSRAWVDSGMEPVVLSTPVAVSRTRFVSLQDMWSDVFAVIDADAGGEFAIVPPRWSGSLPAGITRIDAPTTTCLVIAWMQARTGPDLDRARGLLERIAVTPLSKWGTVAIPTRSPIDPMIDTSVSPQRVVAAMPSVDFFAFGSELLKRNPPRPVDWSAIARAAKVGVVAGSSPSLKARGSGLAEVLDEAARRGRTIVRSRSATGGRIVDGWRVNEFPLCAHGNSYVDRAAACMAAPDALPTEAVLELNLVTDGEGAEIDGGARYVIRLSVLDPIWSSTCWTLSAFDTTGAPSGHLILRADDVKRWAADAFVELRVQPEPGPSGYWLRTTEGPVRIRLRVYGLGSAFAGEVSPPPVWRYSLG